MYTFGLKTGTYITYVIWYYMGFLFTFIFSTLQFF